MNTTDVSAIARHRLETQGAQAIAEQQVEAILREMRGARQS
jgi:hypothetical protein